jgi:hypothetical protein
LLICVGVLPTTLGNHTSDANYNLEVYLTPMRSVFPRIYCGNDQPIGFMAGAVNKGPEASPPFILTFYVRSILSSYSYEYNTTMGFQSFESGGGMGRGFQWRALGGYHIAFYEVRASIDVDDANPFDNTVSFYLLTLSR